MSYLKINTDGAVKTATALKRINKEIRDSFFEVQTAINQMDGTWDGKAAESGIRAFNEIKTKYQDSRYEVMENYANYLIYVGEGYSQTETVNTNLADIFK